MFLAFLPPVFSLANTAINGANSAWGLVGYCLGASAPRPTPASEGGSAKTGKPSVSLEADRGEARSVKPFAAIAAPQKIGLLEFDTYNPADVTDWLNLEGIEPSLATHLHR